VTWAKTSEDIAYELQGTCMSLAAILERHEMEDAELDSEFCYGIDSLVFCCEGCEWWFEISEMCADHDEWKCEDCCHEEGDDS
jgi:hypothetical protein